MRISENYLDDAMKIIGVFTILCCLIPMSASANWIRHDIVNPAQNVYDIVAADFDSNLSNDIAFFTGVVNGDSEWWSNDGSGSFSYQQDLSHRDQIEVGDMDGDGDNDIVARGYGLYVLENIDGVFVEHTISDASTRNFCLADIDQDGDLDIIGGRNELTIYSNIGNLEFSETQIAVVYVGRLDIADFDGDGDDDILMAAYYNDESCRWFENDGELLFTSHFINISPADWYQIAATDVDGDGDNDIIAGSNYDRHRSLFWYSNDGSQNFSPENAIAERLDIQEFHLNDIDGDADLDIVVRSYVPQAAIFFKKTDTGTFNRFTIQENTNNNFHQSIAFADFNGNGLKDAAIVGNTWVAWFEQPAAHALSADLSADGQVQLDWMGGPDNLIEFRIFRNQVLIGSSEQPRFTDPLPDEGVFEYQVVAMLPDGPSQPSNPVTVSWPMPSDLSATLTENGGVDLSWSAAGEGFIDELDEFLEYRIYRNREFLETTQAQQYVDQLPEYGYYDYRVVAVFDGNDVSLSNPADVYWSDDNWDLYEDFNDGLHLSWTLQNRSATNTWNWVQHGPAFATPYIHEFGPPACRIVSPPINISEAEHLLLEYNYRFNEDIAFGNGREEVDYGFSVQGPWQSLDLFRNRPQCGTKSHLFTPDQFDGDQIWISFRTLMGLDDGGYAHFALDNFRASTQRTGFIELELTTHAYSISPGEDTLTYDVRVENHSLVDYENLRFWTRVELPDGREYGPLFDDVFDLPAGQELVVEGLTQIVPGGLPEGLYWLIGYAGYRNQPDTWITSGRRFLAYDGARSDNFIFDPQAWPSTGELPDNFSTFQSPTREELPHHYAVASVFPNPFNPTTTINVALPQSANLTVVVFNTLGQQVAELANGRIAAGSHQFTLDGSGLSSGIYFVQATVPGELNSVQKIVLMK
jgi:FG-GAP-like repeat/Secretion system C-terminal sorting domain